MPTFRLLVAAMAEVVRGDWMVGPHYLTRLAPWFDWMAAESSNISGAKLLKRHPYPRTSKSCLATLIVCQVEVEWDKLLYLIFWGNTNMGV